MNGLIHSSARLGVIRHCAALAVLASVATVSRAQPAVEVLVSTAAFGDTEFDWGRDGVYCPTCNFGAGNARFNWTDRQYHLWVGNIDYYTGEIVPQSGKAALVDSSAAYWSDFGNGPEWAFSEQGSQLVYTRYTPGQPITTANTGIGVASMVNGQWTAGFVSGGLGRILPAPSQTVSAKVATMAYVNATNNDTYWRDVGIPSPEVTMPFQSTGLNWRWVPNTNQLVYVGNAPPDSTGAVYPQVFWYDTDTGAQQQLTFDPTTKRSAFMFPAPEFGNEMVFFTIANRTQLQIYRNIANASGVKQWTVTDTITAPSYNPYMASPDIFFINGRSYVFIQVSDTSRASDDTIPTNLAITGIDPTQPYFRMLTDQTSPPRLREDFEYFITAKGPYIYYSRAIPATATTGPVHEGFYYVDTGLGPPPAQ